MKEHSVSLNIITEASITCTQLSDYIGVSDSIINCRRIEDDVEWIIESNLEKTSSLDNHLDALFSFIPSRGIISQENIIKDVFLVIGIFYDTATCTIMVPTKYLSVISTRLPDAKLEITCYPCDD